MNRQPEDPSGPLTPPVSGHPLGDDAVGDLIRELAAGWHMPPPAPDSRPWPERIRPRRTGGWRWRRWGRAVVAAGAMALLLTVVAAVVAVWLALPRHTGPADGVAALPTASATHTPRPTVNPAWLYSPPPTTTPGPTLPPYAVLGASLPAERVIVDAGSGPALFDIGSGRLTATAPTSSTPYDQLFALPDGSFLCACVASVGTLDPATQHALTTVTVTLRWLGADGTPGRSVTLPTYIGRADPGVTNEPEHAGVTASLSPDGMTLYLGWVVEQPPVWHGGIDVVDLAAGQVVQTLALPDVPNQVASSVGVASPSVTAAPPTPNQVASTSAGVGGASVTVAPSGTLAMIGRSLWSSGGSAPGSWHATAPVHDGHLGPLSALAAGTGGLDGGTCVGSGGPAGFATATTYFEICYGDSGPVVRRVEVSGRALGDTALGGNTAGGFGLGTVVDKMHHLLFVWDPFGRHLERVDLATGQITGRGTLPTASASAGPLADVAHAIGAWLAPAVAAKMYINPSLAISPDGSRLFAIGTATADPLTPGGGSTGVWVFDTSSLVTVAHWAPVADYVSLTLNEDGSLLLVAGMPGTDAAGNSNDQAASVTIYDAATGAVRAIAGQVQPNSAGWVMFPSLTP